jgi:hypothetical protein
MAIFMEWRTTKESERYHVNVEGQVRGPWRVLKPTLMQIGYYSVALSLGGHKVVRRYVHKLVADAFLGSVPEGFVINHKNQDKLDNRLENLEIVSRRENAIQWAQPSRSDEAGRKRNGYCGRGHKLQGDRTYCNECRRFKGSGHEFQPPQNTEWRNSIVEGYLISSDGRLWSQKTLRLIRTGINKPGYSYANLRTAGKTKPFAIHRLVAETFLQTLKPCNVIDHKDGNKLNNSVDNLLICSRSENTKAFRNRVRSLKNHGYKLNDDIVAEIKYLLSLEVHTQKHIAKQFGVGQSIISEIKLGRKWAHIPFASKLDNKALDTLGPTAQIS